MDRNQQKRIRQKFSRGSQQGKVNRYGMNAKQLYDRLKATEDQEKTKQVPSSQRAKPQKPVKAVRQHRVNHKTSLLEIPSVSTQFAVQFRTPDWFTFTEKADVSVVVPLYKSASVIKDLINSWDLTDPMKVEMILIDDNCPDNSKTKAIEYWSQRKSGLKGPVGRIFCNPVNQGFATACNVGAFHATGNYIIWLNADTTVTPGWIRPIVRLLRKNEVGLVGNLQIKHAGVWKDTIDSAGSEWSWETMSFEHIGRHIYDGKRIKRPFALNNAPKDLFETQEREMVTGCCIGIRKEVCQELGGFDTNYRIGYWEDSEICMAAKEKGYKIMYQPNSKIYHKGSHSGSGGHKYAQHNINFFKNKWVDSGRIDSIIKAPRPGDKPRVETILLRRSMARGDALMATAIAPALKKKYPGCKVVFNTNCIEAAKNNPHIDQVIQTYEVSEKKFDIYYNLDMAYETRPHVNILQAYADVTGVSVADCELHMHTEKHDKKLPEDYIVIHAGKTYWAGRDWSHLKFEVLAKKLAEMGHNIVCIGTNKDHRITAGEDLRNSLNVHQSAEVIKNSKLFIGIDSFPMHIAQALGVPGVAFFGSVDPTLRLISDSSISSVVAEGLNCLGCLHRQAAPCTSLAHCETGISDCIGQVSVERMIKKVEELL